LTCDSLGRHVVRCADEGIRISLGTEFSTDTKVAQFYLAVAAEEDVAWFDISMDDLFAVEVCEAVQDPFSDLSEHFFAGPATEFLDLAVDGVERAAFAKFHGDGDGGCGGLNEGTVIEADVVGCAVLVEIEFSNDLALHIWVGVCCDNLKKLIGVEVSYCLGKNRL